MKRLSLIVSLALSLSIFVAPPANANTITFPCGGSETYSVLMPQGILLDGKKCSGSLVIDQSVTVIGTRAFNGTYSLTSVIIPGSVTTIDEGAFQSSSLNSVVIPNSVTSIKRYAFSFTKLTSVNLPTSISTITDQSFAYTLITSIVIPDSVRTIELGAFTDTPLSSITFSKNTSEIGSIAFRNTKLVNVVLPDSVKKLGSNVFSNNPNLQSVSLPDGLETIGLPSFESNYSLKKVIFCGSFPTGTFPVATECPPERQAVIDAAKAAAKAAADKVAAELKAKQEAEAKAIADAKAKQQAEAAAAASEALKFLVSQVASSKEELAQRIRDLIKKYPSDKKIDALGRYLSVKGMVNEANYKTFEVEIYRISGEIDALEERLLNTRTTITCVKGKLTKKVTAIKPKCPTGYKLKK
jgi:hypothetical protein